MKTPSIIAIIIGVLSLSISVITLIRTVIIERNITNPEALQKLNKCYNGCIEDRDADVDSLEIRAFYAHERHLQHLLRCQLTSNRVQREYCISSENEAYLELVHGFRSLKAAITVRYQSCEVDCAAAQ